MFLLMCRRQLTVNEPAMGCDAGPKLNRNWVGRLASCVRGTSSRRVQGLISECHNKLWSERDKRRFTGKYGLDDGQHQGFKASRFIITLASHGRMEYIKIHIDTAVQNMVIQ